MAGEAEANMTAKLASYVESTKFSDLPPETIENAKLAILDSVACALAASKFDVGKIMIEHVREMQCPGTSTVIAGGFRTSAPLAAYVNGHLANALDYDVSLHLDTHVLPSAFAVGEQLNVNGVTFLEAYIVAREVGGRLMKAIDGKREEGLGVTHRGWWHAGIVASLDSGLVAAKLLQLDQEAIQRTLGIASCSVGGFRRNLGTMAKSLHSGKGARDGVHAAFLAQKGFTGDPEILEIDMGFIAALCPDGDFDTEVLYDGLGTKYILSSAPKGKPYPSCGPTMGQIAAALDILANNSFKPDDIERVVVHFHPHSLFRPEAKTEIEAGFSTPYIIAATLVDGEFTLKQLGNERLHDPEIRDLMARFEHNSKVPGSSVTVYLRDGQEFTSGTNTRPWFATWDQMSEKFDVCADGRLSESAAEEFKSALLHIEDVDNIGEILDILYKGHQKLASE